MTNHKRYIGAITTLAIALSQSAVWSQAQQAGYYPAPELANIPGLIYDPPPEAFSPTFNQIPGATAPGNIISPTPGESRAWPTGARLTDFAKFRDLEQNPQFAGFTKMSLRDFSQNIGTDIGGVPLKDIELVNGLNLEQVKAIYNNGNIKIKDSLPVVQAVIGVVFDPNGAAQQVKENALSTGQKILINKLREIESLKDVPFEDLLQGDWRGTITQGEQVLLRELGDEMPEHLRRLPIGSLTIAVIEGDWSAVRQQAQDYAINEIYEMTLDEALERFPELQKIPVGSIAQIANQPLDESLPQIADLAIENIPGVEDKFLSAVPGLGDSPLGAALADVIIAFIAGDVFAKFDIAHSGQEGSEEFHGRPLSGGTPDNKFKVIPGIKSTDSKSDEPKKGFPRWEMKPAEPGGLLDNEPLLGKEWMDRIQKVPGCKGILCIFGRWEPAGIKPVRNAPVKFSLGETTEYADKPSTSRVWVDFNFCITIVFTEHCIAHILSFKTPWKVQDESLFPVLARRRVQDYFPGVDPDRRTVDFCKTPTFLASAGQRDTAGSSPPNPDTKYGHPAYEETKEDLYEVTSVDGVQEGLTEDAAQAFEQMRADAAAQGLDIRAVSGFRDVASQEQLWKDQVARQGSPEAAAKISAPPGHSEHHTGLAVDVGTNANPSLDANFANTPEYAWLQKNADKYGFELSFPEGGTQGAGFEPWHWRYVGSEKAEQTFATARGTSTQVTGSTSVSQWGSPTDIHNLIVTSALESTGLQNQVDVAVSIMNRVNSPQFPNTITEVVYQPGQYEPNFGYSPVNSKEEAIQRIALKTGSIEAAIQEYETLEAALNDPQMVTESQAFLGGATDFRGQVLLHNMKPGDPYRGGAGANFFLQESQNPELAASTLGSLGARSASSGMPCNPAIVAGVPGTISPDGDGIATGRLQNPLPGASVSSEFGWRTHPIFGDRRFHEGVDLPSPAGAPILAADGGTVDFAGWNSDGYGYLVVIDHGNGLATWYAHNTENNVETGQKVSAGQQVALVGSTGNSTGPHLDFGVLENYTSGNYKSGVEVNPRKYVSF